MEDKKKKNKNKKKNKQNKTNVNATSGSGETESLDHIHVDEDKNHVLETADFRNGDVGKSEEDLDEHRMNEAEGSVSVIAETEKQNWLNKEATLEETIKHLQSKEELYREKEVGLKVRIVQLESEKESWLLKEASMGEMISQLRDEKAILSSKGASLEERIDRLLDEKAILSSKGESLEKKFDQLLDENAILSSQKVNFDERMEQLEREQDSWVIKENSSKEIIESLNYDKTRLQMQVMEVEESRNKLVHENHLLVENLSGLQSEIQSLENTCSARSSTETRKASENEDLNAQLVAARSLVENLATENAELVEKVNELHIKHDRQSQTMELASAIDILTVTVPDILPQSTEVLVSDKTMESMEADPILNGLVDGINMVSEYTSEIVNEPETGESREIVQIPLDENEVEDLESQVTIIDETEALPISDAPLIGAPFRFVENNTTRVIEPSSILEEEEELEQLFFLQADSDVEALYVT